MSQIWTNSIFTGPSKPSAYHFNLEAISTIALDADKARHLKFIIPQLWVGKTETVLEYLRTKVTPRREKVERVLGCSSKYQVEIINDNGRSRLGKVIGSGRMEKGSDLSIGKR